jgi:hypothetical protein
MLGSSINCNIGQQCLSPILTVTVELYQSFRFSLRRPHTPNLFVLISLAFRYFSEQKKIGM